MRERSCGIFNLDLLEGILRVHHHGVEEGQGHQALQCRVGHRVAVQGGSNDGYHMQRESEKQSHQWRSEPMQEVSGRSLWSMLNPRPDDDEWFEADEFPVFSDLSDHMPALLPSFISLHF